MADMTVTAGVGQDWTPNSTIRRAIRVAPSSRATVIAWVEPGQIVRSEFEATKDGKVWRLGNFNGKAGFFFRPEFLDVSKRGDPIDVYFQDYAARRTPPVPIPPPVDQPPVISGVVVSDITETSVRVRWHVSELSTGHLDYRVQGTTAWATRQPEQISPTYTDHDQTLSGLVKATDYEYRVRSSDTAGQETTSPVGTFKTLGTVTQPPTEPPTGSVQLPPSIDATGATDVTSALLTFFESVPPRTTILFRGDGQYRVDGQLRFPTERTGFYADGQGATIFRSKEPAGAEDSLWRMNRCTDMRFRRFTLDGASNQPGHYRPLFEWQHAFDILGGGNIDLGELTVRDFVGDGLYVSDWSGPGTGIRFHDSFVTGSSRCGVAPVGAKSLVIERVTFDNTGMCVIDCEPNGSPQFVDDVLFTDNVVKGRGVQFLGLGGNGPISNVTIQRTNADAAAWGLYTYGWSPGPRRTNIRFLDNHSVTDVDHGTGGRLYFTHVDGLTVTGNVIAGVGPCVKAVNSTGISVSGNTPCTVQVG